MTEIESLITKARRYCIENHDYWSKRYDEEQSGKNNPYTDNDYNLFPRYNALNTILNGIELVVDKKYDSFEQCKVELKNIGFTSHSISTINGNDELHLLGKAGKYFRKSGKLNETEKKAIQDERMKFADFIDSLTPENVMGIEPLPYTRRLGEDESEFVRGQLLKIWNFDGGYWEPIEEKSPQPTVFLMNDNLTESDKNELELKISQILNGNKFYRINDVGIDYDYELEADSLDIDIFESIICDKSFEWVVYGSNESTIAFGGKALIDKVKELFENRKDKLDKWEQNW